MLKKVLIVLLMGAGVSSVLAQDKKNQWVDSVFQSLSTEEKIGQLFVLPISSYAAPDELENFFEGFRGHPGGIMITGGGPVGTASLINQLQEKSNVPLLVMMDAENGPGKVLDSLMQFPYPLALGAIADNSRMEALGAEIARQMKLLGINMNMAPNIGSALSSSQPFGF
ncbi:MAG TPA: glycoside hydrolase family 3 N-terminal domain-containing protein, partial [Cyclobacteriaceae bacterium]|nr:glycoside hydrolase family 3 N-terminal domain-containing protein [Cyclobacteriaceae bacterium]